MRHKTTAALDAPTEPQTSPQTPAPSEPTSEKNGLQALRKVTDAPARERRDRASKLMRQRAFLREFRKCGIVGKSCELARMGRSTFDGWMREDERFQRLYAAALDHAADLLEWEARRRAEHGWDEPVFQRGGQVGVIRKYSDNLMITLLKGMKPDVYKDRTESSVTVKAALIDPKTSTDAELTARLDAALATLKRVGEGSTQAKVRMLSESTPDPEQ